MPTELTDARSFAGNWKEFRDYGVGSEFRNMPHAERYGMDYWHNRDSDLLTESNWDYAVKKLQPFINLGFIIIKRDSHWGPGWVEGFWVYALRKDGQPSAAFNALEDLHLRLDDYPIFDEDDFSRREWESTWSNLTDQVDYVCRREDIDPTDAEALYRAIYNWLDANDSRQLEASDFNGAYPSTESIRSALIALGHLIEESEASEAEEV